MDEMVCQEYGGWLFVCSGEQLPWGQFQAVVRYITSPPGNQLQTLTMDPDSHATSRQALSFAKELALQWSCTHPHPYVPLS